MVEEYVGVAAVFASETMRRVLSQVKRAAASNAVILITGESGCGKEIVARAIHHFSPRRAKSWVDVNCAALPESLLKKRAVRPRKRRIQRRRCRQTRIV